MVMSTQENGKTIKLMAKVYIYIKMGPGILEIGLRIPNTDLVARNGSMDHLIKGNYSFYLDIIQMVPKMGKANLHGKTVIVMKELLLTILFREKAS